MMCVTLTVAFNIPPEYQIELEQVPPLQILLVLYGADGAAVTAAAVSVLRPPRVSKAELSPDLRVLHLTLDQAVKPTAARECCDCSQFFASLILLGSGPLCIWLEENLLAVYLGGGSSLVPGMALSLQGVVSSGTGLSLVPPEGGHSIVTVSAAGLASLQLNGPSFVASCDSADIVVCGGATGPGAEYFWSCYSDRSLDMLLRNQTRGSSARVSGAWLSAGRRYAIAARACFFHTACSDWAIHYLSLAEAPVPLLSIDAPPSPLYRSRLPSLFAKVAPSSCLSIGSGPAAELSLQWILFDTSGVGNMPLTSFAGESFTIPNSLVRADHTYLVYLTALTASGDAVQTQLSIFIAGEQPIALLAGGDRTVPAKGTIVLNASASYDPNSCNFTSTSDKGAEDLSLEQPTACERTSIRYSWMCTSAGVDGGGPCRFSDQSVLTIPDSPFVTLDLASLALPANGLMAMTVVVSTSSGAAARTATLAATSDARSPLLDVQVAVIYSNPDALALTVQLAFPVVGSTDTAGYLWGVTDWTGTELQLTDGAAFPAGARQRNLLVRLDSPWARAKFHSAMQYTFNVTVVSSTGTGFAWFNYKPSLPPTGGICAAETGAAAAVGVAALSPVAVVCSGWAGLQPILFQFTAAQGMDSAAAAAAAAAATTAGSDLTWTQAGAGTRFEVQLPPGSWAILAKVVGGDGQAVARVAAIINVSGTASPNSRSMPLAALTVSLEELESAGRYRELILLCDAVAAAINVDACQFASGPGSCQGQQRRRLLGSSAAYRSGVRRLLLQRLSGKVTASLTSITAPVILRAVRRAAAFPSELGTAGAANAAAVLVAAAVAVGSRALRGASLADSAALSRNTLIGARQTMSVGDSDILVGDVAGALLDMAHRYGVATLDGERPLSIVLSGLTLRAAPLSPLSGAANSTIATDDMPAVYGGRTKGVAVVQISSDVVPWAINSSDEDRTMGARAAADDLSLYETAGIGVRLLSDYGQAQLAADISVGRRGVPACPSAQLQCISFRLAFEIASSEVLVAADADATCQRWATQPPRWDETACDSSAPISVGADRGVVSCTCSGDGIYRASIRRLAPEPDVPVPSVCLLVSQHSALLGPIALIAALAAALAAAGSSRLFSSFTVVPARVSHTKEGAQAAPAQPRLPKVEAELGWARPRMDAQSTNGSWASKHVSSFVHSFATGLSRSSSDRRRVLTNEGEFRGEYSSISIAAHTAMCDAALSGGGAWSGFIPLDADADPGCHYLAQMGEQTVAESQSEGMGPTSFGDSELVFVTPILLPSISLPAEQEGWWPYTDFGIAVPAVTATSMIPIAACPDLDLTDELLRSNFHGSA